MCVCVCNKRERKEAAAEAIALIRDTFVYLLYTGPDSALWVIIYQRERGAKENLHLLAAPMPRATFCRCFLGRIIIGRCVRDLVSRRFNLA